MMRSVYRLIALAVIAASAHSTNAQTLEPRSYTNLPVGLTFLALAGGRSEGDVSPTPSSPLQEAELRIDAAVVAVSHSFALAEKSARVDLSAGRTCYEGSAIFRGDFVEGRRCENLDPRLKLTWNFYGAPAMGLTEFMKWQPNLVAGVSMLAVVPAGTYNSEHLINAGANRWMLRPGIGMTWWTGPWQLELKGAVALFEDNDDFFGGIHTEQDPLYDISLHAMYNFSGGRWLSVDANYFAGGQTKVGGERSRDRQANSRFGMTFSSPLSQHLSLKLYASTGVATRIGNDFDRFGFGLVYRL